MTSEELTRLFARYRDAFARRDLVALLALYADDCVVESPVAGRVIGRAAIERAQHRWFTVFPDTVIEFGELLITGNQVVQTGTIEGTDTGGLFGQVPTGNHFRNFVVWLYDIGDDGQIVRQRAAYDVNGWLRQLAMRSLSNSAIAPRMTEPAGLVAASVSPLEATGQRL